MIRMIPAALLALALYACNGGSQRAGSNPPAPSSGAKASGQPSGTNAPPSSQAKT